MLSSGREGRAQDMESSTKGKADVLPLWPRNQPTKTRQTSCSFGLRLHNITILRLYVENNQTRPAGNLTDGRSVNTGAGDETSSVGGADFGETTYTVVCEQLKLNRVQRVIDGLSTASLNLKYRCLGPLGAKALAAALSVSTGRIVLDEKFNQSINQCLAQSAELFI